MSISKRLLFFDRRNADHELWGKDGSIAVVKRRDKARVYLSETVPNFIAAVSFKCVSRFKGKKTKGVNNLDYVLLRSSFGRSED